MSQGRGELLANEVQLEKRGRMPPTGKRRMLGTVALGFAAGAAVLGAATEALGWGLRTVVAGAAGRVVVKPAGMRVGGVS